MVLPALTTAPSATLLEWVTCRPISATEEASSSVAAATVDDAGRGLLGGGRGGRGPFRGAVDAGGDLAGDALHVLGGLRDRADHALDVGLEAVGHLALQGLLLELGLRLGGFLRLAQRARLDHVAAEDVDRHGHGAEFVLAVATGDGDVGIAAGEAVHHGSDRSQRTRQAAPEQECQQNGACENRNGGEDQIALRARRRRLVFGGVLDDFKDGDRLAGVIPDLPDIERGRMAVETGLAAQCRAVEYAFQLVRRGDHGVAEGRGEFLELLAVEPMHGEVDTEALLGAIDEFLAEGGPDIGNREALAVAHDRRDAEGNERVARRLDADDRLSGLVRRYDGDATRRDVIAKCLGVMDAQEDRCRRQGQAHDRKTLRLHRLHRAIKQRHQPLAIPLGDGIDDRRQVGDDRADRERRAALIVQRGDDAVILQLELLVERELGQCALLDDGEGPEDSAGHRDRQRDGQDQADGDRSKFEHWEAGAPRGEDCGKSHKILNDLRYGFTVRRSRPSARPNSVRPKTGRSR